MTDIQAAKKLIKILNAYNLITFENPEELLDDIGDDTRYYIELTGKAYGDSDSKFIEDVISKEDLSKLKDLAKQLKIKLPETIYYD